MGQRTIEGWAYVFAQSTGALVSEGTVIVDPLPARFGLLVKAARHDPEAERWDPVTRDLVPYLNAERIAQLEGERDRLNARIAQLGGTP